MKSAGAIIWRMVPVVLVALVLAVDCRAEGDSFAQAGGDTGQNLAEAVSVFSVSSALPGTAHRAAVVATVAPDWHVNSAYPYQDFLIPAAVSFDTLAGLTPGDITYPPGADAVLAGEKMSVYSGRFVIYLSVTVSLDIAPGEYRLPVRFTYQPCNDRECRAPQTLEIPLTISVGSGGAPTHADVFGGATVDAVSPPGSGQPPDSLPTADSELGQLISKYGFWGYIIALGLAFVTGLLLSFSPCTYPMIPITVSIFAGQQRTVGRGFVLSLFYVGSMAVVYGVMGLVVSLVGGVFGAWLASTPVVIGIAVVFVVFALSMFGLYDLNVPASLRQKLGTTRTSGGVLGAIVLGVVAALVVSPCVGPFVAGILVYVATSGSPAIGFLVLFVFALGLGTLFVIIGTFSSAISALPRSGEWMESVKKFFGFVLLIMAVYFLRTVLPTAVTAILAGLILLVLGVFGGGLDRLVPESGFFLRLKRLVGIVALIFGVYFVMGALVTEGWLFPSASRWLVSDSPSTSGNEETLVAWESDLNTGLTQARASARPVLIDTWATWCVNCRVMDKKTFANPRVAEEARRFVSIKVQLEKSDSPISREFMSRFGLKYYTLPTTLLLDSTGTVRRIMQGVVGAEEMLAEMRKVR